ncbi:zeta toxin family protein [Variovorax rhizosphaerae]|uniref:Zeta toxin family protein n=1 Tax=Variovorax rhizosphaerae TaxID=1836200 RepID=A0ABU8WXA6_9BURK
MELPDIMRMMITKAVRIGDFSIDPSDATPPAGASQQDGASLEVYEPRYWGSHKEALEAELALTLLQQAVADRSVRIGLHPQARPLDAEMHARLQDERDEALRLLAGFDPGDRKGIEELLKRFRKVRPTSTSFRRWGITSEERERIYETCIEPDVLANALPADNPVAMIVAGQLGAGVSSAAAALRRELLSTAGAAVHLSAERLRAYQFAHQARLGDGKDSDTVASGGHSHQDVAHWLRRAVDEARQHRLHMVIEDEVANPKLLRRLATALRTDGYAVQIVLVCTTPLQSRLSIVANCHLRWINGLALPPFSAQEHDQALEGTRSAIALLEKRGGVDGIRVIARDGHQYFENRWAGVEWLRAPRALAVFDTERDRAVPPKDEVKLLMCWEMLVQDLTHDPTIPRELASLALTWRNEVAARCEASPATAQFTQYAREGAAFRTMNRFEFEKEFPHHAKAAALLGRAVIEAEKYDAAEGERLVRSARENIAQRIERGDMARIAARAQAFAAKASGQ